MNDDDMERPNVAYLAELRDRLKGTLSRDKFACRLFPGLGLEAAKKRVQRLLRLRSEPDKQVTLKLSREYAIGARRLADQFGIDFPGLGVLAPHMAEQQGRGGMPSQPQEVLAAGSLGEIVDARHGVATLDTRQLGRLTNHLGGLLERGPEHVNGSEFAELMVLLSQANQRRSAQGDSLRHLNAQLLGVAARNLGRSGVLDPVDVARLLHERGVALHNCRDARGSVEALTKALRGIDPVSFPVAYVRALCDLGFTAAFSGDAKARELFQREKAESARDVRRAVDEVDLILLHDLTDNLLHLMALDWDRALAAVRRQRRDTDFMLQEIDPMWRAMLGFGEGLALAGLGEEDEAELVLRRAASFCRRWRFEAMQKQCFDAIDLLDRPRVIVDGMRY
ncbi:MAG: hypothetical protein R3F29_09440 [Planctomycetota bacterium]